MSQDELQSVDQSTHSNVHAEEEAEGEPTDVGEETYQTKVRA